MSCGRSRLASLGLVLFAALAASGVQLYDAHVESRDAAERRFVQRAQISAALTQSVLAALSSAFAEDLGDKLGGSRVKRRRALARLVREGDVVYAAVLDERGRVLDRAGGVMARRGAAPAAGVLSDVRRTARGAVVELSVPFESPAGRRVLVEAVPIALMRPLLENFLRRLPNPDRATVAVVDGGGAVLAHVMPKTGLPGPHDVLTVAAAVPQTTWRLRMQADRVRVLAGSGGASVAWALLAGLVVAILFGLWLCARVMAASRRTSTANGALRESEGKLRALVGALEEAVFLTHADGRIELLNESAKALAETEADVVKRPRGDWLSVTDDGEPMNAADTPAGLSLANGTAQRRVIGMDRPGRERIWLDVTTRPLFRPGETTPYAAVSSCTDVTERQNLEAHLFDLADRDPLTGLWNRRRFEQDVAHQLDRCRRYGERAALVLMDIDGFKQVNDVLGHLAGDEVLCALADTLSSRLRTSDRAARLGGDEFAVLLLATGGDDVTGVARELAAAMGAAGTAIQDRISMSISFGTAQLGQTTGGVDEALKTAERALYGAKRERGAAAAAPGPPAPEIAANAEVASLRALLAAVNARDSYTAMHSRKVVTLARAVARRLGLGEAETSEVEHIALLHDLGKIAIPDAILRKPEPLTSHEQTLMRQHPVVGAQILASMPELAHLAPAARAEHERWDGTGYPDGLCGEQIPIASRIILVCDAYHAMTSNRPYRRAMSAAAAREEIRREAGAQFCPYAAAALLDVLAVAPAHV